METSAGEGDGISRKAVVGFGGYLIVLSLFLLYLLVQIWPDEIPPKASSRVFLFGMIELQIPLERRYLLIAIVAGALGSYIHLATSFADYVGNRQLVSSWLWWYMLRPFIGMTLGVIVYFVVRGGLIMPSGDAGTLSPYGIAALAALAGMFSKQATDKLREVFENFFRTERPPERKDELKA